MLNQSYNHFIICGNQLCTRSTGEVTLLEVVSIVRVVYVTRLTYVVIVCYNRQFWFCWARTLKTDLVIIRASEFNINRLILVTFHWYVLVTEYDKHGMIHMFCGCITITCTSLYSYCQAFHIKLVLLWKLKCASANGMNTYIYC